MTVLVLFSRFSTFTTLHQAEVDQGAQNKTETAKCRKCKTVQIMIF